MILHEDYSHWSNEWDIAVIRLPRPLTYNDYVQPVCLPSTPVADGTDCVVTGWGQTEGAPIRGVKDALKAGASGTSEAARPLLSSYSPWPRCPGIFPPENFRNFKYHLVP